MPSSASGFPPFQLKQHHRFVVGFILTFQEQKWQLHPTSFLYEHPARKEANFLAQVHIINGDALEQLKRIPSESIDSVVTDPPYGIGFYGAKWDTFSSNQAYAKWVESWAKEALRVLKPGGFLLSFAGTKTYHALAFGVESAGFDIRDQLIWLYTSGMPKMPDIARARHIDHLPSGLGADLKPAHEPILVARKPLIGTLEENFRLYGVGAFFVERCRIGDAVSGWKGGRSRFGTLDGTASRTAYEVKGRYPANVATLDADHWTHPYFGVDQENLTPKTVSTKILPEDRDTDIFGRTIPVPLKPSAKMPLRRKDREHAGEGRSRTVQKTTARNPHPTSKPTPLLRWLIRLVTPETGHVLDPFCGSGSTLKAAVLEGCQATGIEREPMYAKIARFRAGLWNLSDVESLQGTEEQPEAVQLSLFGY
ncbi:MAG: site-specific DNA-methyltransferase [Firmicutes bacterium]|nr:site-specific DNA-methyltransferase [Bacillota bacterium]